MGRPKWPARISCSMNRVKNSCLFYASLTPCLNELVVVNSLTLRFLIDLRLWRTGLAQPYLWVDALIELWTAFLLRPGTLYTRHDFILLAGEIVHGPAHGYLTGNRLADILPPQLCQLRIIRHAALRRSNGVLFMNVQDPQS